MYMHDSEKISDMIKILEKHSYSYTRYKHQNGENSINTEILLKQLKLNETEIRANAIDEFVEECKKFGFNNYPLGCIKVIAEQLKVGEKNDD